MWGLLLLLAVISASVSAGTDKFVCYYGSWSHYRTGNGKYPVDNINPNLCTHLIYGFVGINTDGSIRIMDSWLDIDLAALKKFNGMKSKNSNLRTLVAIGGWNEGSTKFSTVVSSPSLRANFIKSSISFMQTHGFDGFDLDWEYPNQRGGVPSDINNFSTLLAEMRAEYDKYGFLLTAAVAAAGGSVDLSYDVPKLNKYLDFINVMAYDLHGAWETVTGHNAPLYRSAKDPTDFNVDACIRGWISRGAAPEKLILGVGSYGRTFSLASSSNTGIGATAYGAGTGGQYTGESGFLGYNEICEKLQGGAWTVVWDNDQKVPYAYSGNQWVGYDNVQSLTEKVTYAKNMNLGGIMIWSVETDDFTGKCGSVNPLLTAIKNNLTPGYVPPPTPDVPVTTAPVTPETTQPSNPTPPPSPAPSGSCTSSSYYRDESDCGVFHMCQDAGGGATITHTLNCPSGLHFDNNLQICNWPRDVSC